MTTINDVQPETTVYAHEVTRSRQSDAPWYRRVSWGAILAGLVVALLSQLALEILGVAIGVGAFEPGEDRIGPNLTSAVAIWLAASALLSLFAGGLTTGKLAGTIDGIDGILHALVMMGLATFISLFVLTSAIGSTVRGVSNLIGEGLSLVGTAAEDISSVVASSVELRDSTLEDVREEAESILAEDASLTSLRIAIDDYLLTDEPGDDVRQAAIEALASQTTLTEAEAAQQLDEWEAEIDRAVTRFETEAERVANDVADAIAATAGIIFMILVAGAFAAGAGGYVAVSAQSGVYSTETLLRRRQSAEITP